MIYFDNAATTFQKPESVYAAVNFAMRNAANPGRSAHAPAMLAADTVFRARETAAELFGLNDPKCVIFTNNCTTALNMAIKGILANGGHAVISGYEHNSVVRPLEAMKCRGVSYTVASSPLFDKETLLKNIRKSITQKTKCVIICHVSNVFGYIMPIAEIDEICRENRIPLILDAAQSAGIIGFDVSLYKSLAFVCMPGHKGLMGPQGTGILLCCKKIKTQTILEGGTGSNSQLTEQPDFLPDRFESGTLNVPGIAGLLEGMKFIKNTGTSNIAKHENEIICHIANGLGNIGGIEVFFPNKPSRISGVLSFRCQKFGVEELAAAYAERGICVRAGLHCSPLAHKSAGTLDTGTVRVSVSCFSTIAQANTFVAETANILK